MKNFLKPLAIAAIVCLTFSVTSCDDDDDANSIALDNSIFDTTVDNADFDSLNAALVRTGLDVTLDQVGTFTVFAPTDAAFATFLQDNNFASLDDVPTPLLTNVLLNHVLGSINTADILETDYYKTLATNNDGDNFDMFINTAGGVTVNNGVSVTTADLIRDNGVIHVVDQVITIPTIAELAGSNPAFETLGVALEQEDLVDPFASNSTTGAVRAPYTVFAPTNDAFVALINADPNDGINSAADILALPNLSDILLYHAVSGTAVRADDITNGLVVDPITTGTFTITTNGGLFITDGSGTNVNIIATDITASNGVVHAIDFVLLPE